MSETITFSLDGREVEAAPGETIWQVARRFGVDIPHLCWLPEPGYRADGNCRACMVEIEGERTLAASCIRKPTAGMTVVSASERARTARRMVMELLLADQPPPAAAHHPDSRLWQWAGHIGVTSSRFPRRQRAGGRPQPPGDGGQPRCLHPLHALCPRLPRGPGQRRDRHGLSQCRRPDRVRPGRSHGGIHLRRLRRMRPGLPDRRPDAGPDARRSTASARSRSTARSTASAPIAGSAARSPITSGTTRSARSPAAPGRPTRTVCASRAASASTTSATPTA